MMLSDELCPVERLPYFLKDLPFLFIFFGRVCFCGFDSMHFEIERRRHHFITEVSLPEALILDHMCISVPIGKVNIEILHLFGDLLL